VQEDSFDGPITLWSGLGSSDIGGGAPVNGIGRQRESSKVQLDRKAEGTKFTCLRKNIKVEGGKGRVLKGANKLNFGGSRRIGKGYCCVCLGLERGIETCE